MRKPFLALLTAFAAGTLSPLALAQTASPWPTSKPISVVVPFAAGGAVDYAARMVVTKLGERLGQAGVVSGQKVPRARRVWLVMAGTGSSCRSPQS